MLDVVEDEKPLEQTMSKRLDLEDRLVNFAVRVINVVESLPTTKAANHIAGQLVRAGTSPAANYGEAQSAESRRDFIHKMKIALKELRETQIWMKIIEQKPMCEPAKMKEIVKECDELISIFVKSIATAELNAKQRKD
ncbi:MAG: four helix bundle protein [Aureliella sp.]